jgi:putative endonuclease
VRQSPWDRVRSLFRSLAGRLLRSRSLGGPVARKGENARLGARGEALAARTLRRNGYSIIGRNVTTRAGEADLVCRSPDRRAMVIVEVKTRRVERSGGVFRPEIAVDQAKRRKLRAIARLLARANSWNDVEVRVDVVAVEFVGNETIVRHHEGILRHIR